MSGGKSEKVLTLVLSGIERRLRYAYFHLQSIQPRHLPVNLPVSSWLFAVFIAVAIIFVGFAGRFPVIPAHAGIQSLDPGSSPNAVDLSRMPLIQNPCFRRGLSLVIPAEAGIQVFLIFPGPRPSPG